MTRHDFTVARVLVLSCLSCAACTPSTSKDESPSGRAPSSSSPSDYIPGPLQRDVAQVFDSSAVFVGAVTHCGHGELTFEIDEGIKGPSVASGTQVTIKSSCVFHGSWGHTQFPFEAGQRAIYFLEPLGQTSDTFSRRRDVRPILLAKDSKQEPALVAHLRELLVYETYPLAKQVASIQEWLASGDEQKAYDALGLVARDSALAEHVLNDVIALVSGTAGTSLQGTAIGVAHQYIQDDRAHPSYDRWVDALVGTLETTTDPSRAARVARMLDRLRRNVGAADESSSYDSGPQCAPDELRDRCYRRWHSDFGAAAAASWRAWYQAGRHKRALE